MVGLCAAWVTPMKRINFETGLLALYVLLAVTIQYVYTRHFIADDSYFYMATARNIALTGEQTFSGLFPTNGVHPLWLYVLSLFSWLGSLVDTGYLYEPVSVIPIFAAVTGLAAYLSWRAAALLGINRFVFTALPVGYLTAFPLLGSEASVSYCCLSLLILIMVSPVKDTRFGPVWIGLAVALTFLARLDAIFFAASFYLWYAITQKDLKKVAVSVSVAALVGAVYVISNLVYFGGVFPISGWLKSSFPDSTISGLNRSGLNTSLASYHILFGLLPIIVSTVMLAGLRKRISRPASIVYALWGGCVLHFVYMANFAVQGALWYYVLHMMLITLTLALALQVFERFWRPAFSGAVFLALVAVLVGYAARDAVIDAPGEDECSLIIDYLADHRIEHETIIVVDCPGEAAFRTTNHVIALDMLTANRHFVDDMRQSPNGFQFIFDTAAEKGKPVSYLIWTTNTWLGMLTVDRDRSAVSYWFRYPDLGRYRYMGTVELGPPETVRADLIVWKITD